MKPSWHDRRRVARRTLLGLPTNERLRALDVEAMIDFLDGIGEAPTAEARELVEVIEQCLPGNAEKLLATWRRLHGDEPPPADTPDPDGQRRRSVLAAAVVGRLLAVALLAAFAIYWWWPSPPVASSLTSFKLPAPTTAPAESPVAQPPAPVPAETSSTEKTAREPAPPPRSTEPPLEGGELATDKLGVRFHYVPPGTIERLGKEIEVSRGLWVMETEVPQDLWQRVTQVNRSGNQACSQCPAENLSWYEAVAFANHLSSLLGRGACYQVDGYIGEMGGKLKFESVQARKPICEGYRLLTDAEWQQAAWLKTDSLDRSTIDGIAWHQGNAAQTTHPVGRLGGNRFGLKDMFGNVREWVFDEAPEEGKRWARGGSYGSPMSVRFWEERKDLRPAQRDDALGFRLASDFRPDRDS